MGATVLDAVRVTSRTTATGEVAYLWHEETHDLRGDGDSNWCVMAFGNKADIIRRIYLMAESVASGMLKVGGQSVTAFIDAMLKKLDSPGHMRCETVLLENTNGKAFYGAITPHNRAAIRQFLREIGRLDLAEKIEEPGDSSQKVEFVLDDDFQALRGIINSVEYDGLDINDHPARRKGIAAWKVFRYSDGMTCLHADGSFGPTDEIQAVEQLAKLDLEVYATDINVGYGNGADPENAFVAMLNNKPIYFGGIQYDNYCLTQALVKSALDVHLKTGQKVLRPLLKTLKNALASPKSLPDDTVIRFDCEGYSDRWMKEKIGEVRDLLGQGDDGQPQFSTTFGDLAKISSPSCNSLRYVIDSVKAEFVLQSQPALF
jgi:hypothetical protein